MRLTAKLKSDFQQEIGQSEQVYFWSRENISAEMLALYTNEWRDFLWYRSGNVIRVTNKPDSIQSDSDENQIQYKYNV